MKQGLRLQTAQRLSLTPQLRKSLELLQMTSQQLEQVVAQELVDNPLLDADISSAEPSELVPQEAQDHNSAEEAARLEWPEQIQSSGAPYGAESENLLEQTIAAPTSLVEHLAWQINLSNLPTRDKRIANHLIHCLDEDAYLAVSHAEMCALFPPREQISPEEVNSVLSFIKTLDPVGSGARDLQERLLLLLCEVPKGARGLSLAKLIVREHFDLLAKRDFNALKKTLHLGNEHLHAAIEQITQQNPRIANSFDPDQQDQIMADVVVSKVSGKWVAHIHANSRIQLKVNADYAQLLNSTDDVQSTEFIEQHIRKAKEFIKGVHSRYDTLLAVSQAIVARQADFFDGGDSRLRPLNLRDIAEELELHESTVSRTIAGKYLECRIGVFDLKHFFSSAVGENQESSAVAIQSLIKRMVADEPNHKPLSDSKIAQQLEQMGHAVARRTVAKYRENLQIAPSSQRKGFPLENHPK